MQDGNESAAETGAPHLREQALAQRWDTSTRTLQRWRALKVGPPYIRIGGAVRYRLADVIAYENARLCVEDEA